MACLRIGIDLDNTILDYNDLFRELAIENGWIATDCQSTRVEVKQYLVDIDGHDERWRELQAQAYGPRIGEAKLYEKVATFIQAAFRDGHELFIISHKTKYSSCRPDLEFRNAAIECLKLKGVVGESELKISLNNIFFEATRGEKIQRIHNLKLDVYIDDLLPVLLDIDFPYNTVPIFFSQNGMASVKDRTISVAISWLDIFSIISSMELIGVEMYKLLMDEYDTFPTKMEVIERVGNNRLFVLTMYSGLVILAKMYDNKSFTRKKCGEREYVSSQYLWSHGLHNIPQPIAYNQYTKLGLYEFKTADRLDGEKISFELVIQMSNFVNDLYSVSFLPGAGELAEASASRRCLQDYVDSVNERLNVIVNECAYSDGLSKVSRCVNEELVPLKNFILERFYERVQKNKLDLSELFELPQRILSPSDFGIHNMLVDKNNKLIFLDFEYFGWDDIAKLLADFFHHVCNTITWDMKWYFLDALLDKCSLREPIMQRWKLVIDLVGFEWLLIVLNIADPEVLQRRLDASMNQSAEALIDGRLSVVNNRLAEFYENIKSGREYLTIPKRVRVAK